LSRNLYKKPLIANKISNGIMSKVQRVGSVFLMLFIIASSLVMVQSGSAQSVPKPSVPDFTLQVDGNWLSVIVQNQPVIPNGQDALIAYDIRFKWRESPDWYRIGWIATEGHYIRQTARVDNITKWKNSIDTFYQLLGETSNPQLDYQVRAISGYLDSSIMYSSPVSGVDPNSQPVIIVTASDWSETQTITLPAALPSIAPTQSYTNTQPATTIPPEVDWLEVAGFTALGVVVAMLVVIIVFMLRRIRTLEMKQNSA
jgi:hypothetical protein